MTASVVEWVRILKHLHSEKQTYLSSTLERDASAELFIVGNTSFCSFNEHTILMNTRQLLAYLVTPRMSEHGRTDGPQSLAAMTTLSARVVFASAFQPLTGQARESPSPPFLR
jgi:hypothetical protein